MAKPFRAPASMGAPDPHRCTEMDLLLKAEPLAAASLAGKLPTPLRSRNIGIHRDAAGSAAASLFTSAASELGVHVVCIPITLNDRSSLTVVRDTAVLLSRLYDAVECLDMPPPPVELMQESADVPLFFGLSSDDHWMGGVGDPDEPPARIAVGHMLQAALVHALPS